ncbi:LCP family protein [Streptomyces sp. TRM 70351]|nr:LCP family protein [Streptomyces sp. TRM 70351]MEE1929330.1 LCP family protein [Streptomyces sp. TRM 70351]
MWISACTAGAVLAVSGSGHVVVTGVAADIGRVDPFEGLRDRPEQGEGVNFLVVGVDGREKLTDAQKRKYHLGGASCRCTDTLMLVHLSAGRDRASVVSLPRDTYTTIPPHTDPGTGDAHGEHRLKLNAAYTHGGPELTVRTVEKMTGVRVHHYLEVDFTSFMRTVDVLGGVPVCTVEPLKDSRSGLDLPAGTTVLNGGEALQYVRSRYVDGEADLGRMQRQQRFLASVIDQVTAGGVLLNPGKLKEVASAVLGSVRADTGLGSAELLALGQAMRGFDPASSEFTTVPVQDSRHRVPGIGETVLWDEEGAAKLFAALREDRPLAPRAEGEKPKPRAVPVEADPRNVRVQVDNGTRTPGLGHRVDQALRATGFDTTGISGNAERRDIETTLIGYDPRWERAARSLLAALPGAELVAEPERGPELHVVVGEDFEEVTPVRPAGPGPGGEDARRHGHATTTGDEVVCP